MNVLFHETLGGKKTKRPPFWFMRQAGRYLPEYRELRQKAGDFLTLCYTPEWAAEVTLQPIRRFGMDAAIVFSDILVIPHAMGQKVWFEQGEGPRLDVLTNCQSIEQLTCNIESHLQPVAETLKIVRAELPRGTSLIGFCGAPWTVACYMLEGKTKEYEQVRKFALQEKQSFSVLMDKIIESSVRYLSMQIEAGADVIQIFDSWAGVLSERGIQDMEYRTYPEAHYASKKRFPSVPVIGFARGSGAKLITYGEDTPVTAVGIDTQTPFAWAVKTIEKPVQGNLDPLLLAGEKTLVLEETKKILAWGKNKPFIFNLGHGIVPSTPVENVQAVCDLIREEG